MKQNLKVIFLGTPEFVQPIKKALGNHFILVNSMEKSDLAVVAAYGKILTENQLETPKFGCINIHPSLLPKYRGPSPIQQAILNGDKVSGITIIYMDKEVDHGPIIYQESLDIPHDANFHNLSKKMFLRAAEILPHIIENLVAGKIKLREQNHNKSTYSNLLTRESGYILIDSPTASEKLGRMIRAYYPWPGVWTRWNNKIVKFLPHGMMQVEGKIPISQEDFLNGYPNFPKEIFSSLK
jgi:methionyl-tRNA formyltransferase